MEETQKQGKVFKLATTLITIIVTILLLIFIIYGIKNGIFSSDKSLTTYIKKLGFIAPIVFLLIQIIQVIFPVIPGGASCLAGVIAFGPIWGFVLNYIGLCIGSYFAFLISKKYGMKIIRKLFKEQTIDKYLSYIHHKKFNKIFFWGILLPGAPDDLLCYIAGITTITKKQFASIILIGKPLTLIGYSISIAVLPLIQWY